MAQRWYLFSGNTWMRAVLFDPFHDFNIEETILAGREEGALHHIEDCTMTYCFAWKYQDAVCLLADTLVTQCIPAGPSTTSMGEPHRQLGRDQFVQERQLKIRELKDGVVVAIAGDVQIAHAITDFMQDNIDRVKGEGVAAVLSMVETSLGPFDSARLVEILVIQGTEDGECAITKWDTQSRREDAARWAYIGSLAREHVNRMADLFLRLIADQHQKPSKEAMLLAGMAFVISLSKHEDLIAQYIGGVVCGLRVQRGKTIWPDDLIIVQHRDGFKSIEGRISVHAREGTVCINSTYHGATGSIFVNKHSDTRIADVMRDWNQKWLPYLKDYLGKHFKTCTRWLFINLDRQVPLVFVVHGHMEQAKNMLHFESKRNGDYAFVMGSELSKIVLREAPSVGPDLRILEVVIGEALPDGMIQTP